MATVGLIIDVVIIALLVIFGLIGFKKGFLKSILSLFSWIVCLVVAVLTAKYVAGWINGIYDFSALIGDKIAKGLVKSNEFFATSINTFANKDAVISAIPDGTNKLLTQLIKIVFSNTAVDWQSTSSIGSIMGASLGHIVMIVIAGILVFVVLMIVVALLTKFLNKIASTKIIGGLNKILGLCLGVIKAGCIIVIINGVLIALSLVPTVNKMITPVIQDNTYVEKFVYNQTDKYVGKYIIEGDVIDNWVDNLWENRNK